MTSKIGSGSGGCILGIQVHGASMPWMEALCASQFAPQSVRLNLALEEALAQPADSYARQYRYVTGRLPLPILQRSGSDRVYTVLRAPRDMLGQWLHTDGPQMLTHLAQQGLRYDLYREFFSPGFDAMRHTTDIRYGIALHAAAYADGCTVDEALAQLDSIDLVLNGDCMDAELQRLFIETGLQPPLVLPTPATPPATPPHPHVESLLSDFDQRFFQGVQDRWNARGPLAPRAYEQYIDRYCAEQGLRLPPRSTVAWPIVQWLGPGWHPPEESNQGRYFRWSDGTPAALEVPIAEAGWYYVRVYTQPQGLRDLRGKMVVRASGRRTDMSTLVQGDTQIFDAHAHIFGSDWLRLEFEHGPLPKRDGSDPRPRGFVLGEVQIRRIPS